MTTDNATIIPSIGPSDSNTPDYTLPTNDSSIEPDGETIPSTEITDITATNTTSRSPLSSTTSTTTTTTTTATATTTTSSTIMTTSTSSVASTTALGIIFTLLFSTF
uniref:Uncharacterized protein n=1 Tax=Mesocestoides corti TaxID=53468 RepID=A0A5K3G4Q2_MESCO